MSSLSLYRANRDVLTAEGTDLVTDPTDLVDRWRRGPLA